METGEKRKDSAVASISDQALDAIAARLQRQLEHERQRDEAERQRILERARIVGEVAQRFSGVRRLYLFGSVLVPGQFYFETSDVDVGVVGTLGVEFFKLGAALDQHFDRTVDLIDIDPTTPFGQLILTRGVCIYDAK
ncbi:MAG: nucleotidyltransferase domain-containing protein [Acidobacteria bacterium]|nr:nucleotidyltransferase domain-containing protein [Acidobacteriota bacterium]